MSLIDVKRNGKSIVAVLVDNPQEKKLGAFRELIGTLSTAMRQGDRFLSKGGSPITQEAEVNVGDIVVDDAVNVQGEPEPVQIQVRVKRDGQSGPVSVNVEELLCDFRKQLLLKENERFQEKNVAGSTFALSSEKGFKVQDAVYSVKDAQDRQIDIVAASPKRDITVQKGASSQKFPEVEESQSLLQFKRYLVANNAMAASDIFIVGGADVLDGQSETITVARAADNNKIVIKSGPPILGETVPTINLPDTTKNLRDWSQTISYGTPEYPLPAKFTGTALKKDDPEEKWSSLKDNEKQYIFSVRQLGSAIVFPKGSADGGVSSADLTKADFKAVRICVAQPGAKEQNLSVQSSFLMTYSQTVHELRKRAATNVSASIGAKGVAVKGGFTTSNVEINQTDRTKVYMTQLIYKPAVELYFDEDNDIAVADAFTHAIEKAVNQSDAGNPYPSRTRYYNILDVLKKYGHFIPTRFMLGGAFIIEEVREDAKVGKIDEQSTSFSAGVAAEIKGVTAAVEGGRTDEIKHLTTTLSRNQSIRISAIGGDTGAFSSSDPGPWLQSVRHSRNWAVIDYSDLVPTIRYLPPDLMRQCLCLIKAHWADPQTEERTVLNMLEYSTLAESAWMKSQSAPAHEIYGGSQL